MWLRLCSNSRHSFTCLNFPNKGFWFVPPSSSPFALLWFFCFFENASRCNSSWPQTCYESQTGLKPTIVSNSQHLELDMRVISMWHLSLCRLPGWLGRYPPSKTLVLGLKGWLSLIRVKCIPVAAPRPEPPNSPSCWYFRSAPLHAARFSSVIGRYPNLLRDYLNKHVI